MKTNELKGPALDWAVSEAEGVSYADYMEDGPINQRRWSTDWAQGGPIIEREKIEVGRDTGEWIACLEVNVSDDGNWVDMGQYGPTPLIAAMRCFVASKLGDEVEIPEELT
jgi:hypothetical protein